ncbi:Rv3212 family protein [Corynebacterium sp. A21]|uniref:Rv3212 family protein n=1 Tax=Corynebacterium sp. A21 TaxID=3457318 RepID=UPI003FD56524
MNPPLRRTRKDLIATAVIAAVSLAAVGGVWATAPIRGAQLQPAASEISISDSLEVIPETLDEAFTLESVTLLGQHRPLTVAGLLISNDGYNVTAHDNTGQQVWRYERDREICGMGTAWQAVTVAYRNNAGCGDVISIAANTGEYKATRSAPAPDEVFALESNDRVGIANQDRVELWRSDLVRTVEYGDISAPQEPAQQPHPECTITSALTRTELLAVTENCPDGTFLRLQQTTPEDSREPEITQSIKLQDPAARLVGIGQEGAAVHINGEILAFDGEGQVRHKLVSQLSPAIDQAGDGYFSPATADLPNHMSWFDGQRLYLFNPAGLKVEQILGDAIGTGVAVGGKLLYPTAVGIAVADPTTGITEKTLPLERAHQGEVSLSVAGGTIVEKRGDQLVGLIPG